MKAGQFYKNLTQCEPFDLTKDSEEALSKPERDDTFLEPELRLSKKNSKGQAPLASGEDWNVPIVIVSAPGAVGKSALARDISARKQFPLWDLASLKLGSNAFRGTASKSFGDEQWLQIKSELEEGKHGFVFDAFDEAEMTEGWPRVESFVKEIWSFVNKAEEPCVVLLARGNTADYLQLALNDVTERDEAYGVAEIKYFQKDQAEDFVKLQVKRLAQERGEMERLERLRQHPEPFDEALQSIFGAIYHSFGVDENDAWSNPTVRSFLGYAPVLQAIATYMSGFSNYLDIQEAVKEGFFDSEGPGVAVKVMEDLLRREQQDKVVNAVLSRVGDRKEDWNQWNSLYDRDEQINRLLLHVSRQGGSWRGNEYSPQMPPWLIDQYDEVVHSFLPQHPFLKSGRFTGPAFRDFVLAAALKSTSDEVQEAARQEMRQPGFTPTPLLIHFYRFVNDGDDNEVNVLDAKDVGSMYESFASRKSIDEPDNIVIISPPEPDSDRGLHRVEFYPPEENGSVNSREEDRFVMFLRTIGEENEVHIPRTIRNASVYVDGKVVIGRRGGKLEISDTEVTCEEMEFLSENIVVKAKSNSHSVSLRSDKKPKTPPSIDIDVVGDGGLSIHWPEGKQYPWAEYYSNIEEEDSINVDDIFYALRRILVCFRKDRRDDLARYKEMIDQRVVGSSATKEKALNFLLDEEIIYTEGELYKMNEHKATEKGLSWTVVQNGLEKGENSDIINTLKNYVS